MLKFMTFVHAPALITARPGDSSGVPMAAYVVVDLDITDPAVFDDYRKQVPATLAPYGGRFIIRGGATEILEGDWAPKRMVVLEFPDRAAAKAWWSSNEYAAAKAQRQRSARTRLIVVDGV
jgi:uncharacterized protein (DUF1330 family)